MSHMMISFNCLHQYSHCVPGVIVFGSDQEVGGLMRATDRANMSGHFTWIGSDGWGGRTLVSDGNEAQVMLVMCKHIFIATCVYSTGIMPTSVSSLTVGLMRLIISRA